MGMSNRRSFLKQSFLTAAGTGLAVLRPTSKVLGANERVRLGVIGLSRGRKLCDAFKTFDDAHIAYLCDTDRNRLDAAQKRFQADHTVTDLRRILDDKSVDAVVVATPDHWHTPAAIRACEAGKHVYVEKPPSHNIREGRLLVQAAQKYGHVLQVGTQNRSSQGVIEAIQMLRDGVIGDVLAAKVINSQRRSNIGHTEPCEPPAHLDYDIWVGPAPWMAYQPNLVHYGWHWFHNFGTGDMGNDGVHDLDIGRWGLDVNVHPTAISGYGTKLHFDDDQQFPDTQYITFAYPGDGTTGNKKLLIFEMRIWSPYRQEGFENGDIFYGTQGVLMVSKSDGYWVYGERNKLLKERRFRMPETEHQRNFLDAIQSGVKPNVEALTGHLSATLCHLGNICARLGQSLTFDPQTERFASNDAANALVGRTYREGHWASLA